MSHTDQCVCGLEPVCPPCDTYPPRCPECRTALELERRQRARKENTA